MRMMFIVRKRGKTMEHDEFVNEVDYLVRKAARFGEKAWRKGLPALEGDIDENRLGRRDIFEYGMQLAVDGMSFEYIDGVLSRLIANERDENVRRFKEIQKDAVLGIQCGKSPLTTMLYLRSRISDKEFVALREAFSDVDILWYMPLPKVTEPKEFAEQAAYTMRIAYEFSQKSRVEGLLELEADLENLDSEFMRLGFRMVLSAIDAAMIDRILSNIIDLEPNENAKRLKTMQKVSVLHIQAGEPSLLLLHRQMSHLDNSELKAVEEILSDEEFFKEHICGGIEPADEESGTFAEKAARIVHRACEFSEKAQSSGLLSLENAIDMDKVMRRDIFEYGLIFVMNSMKPETIEEILSRLIAHEQDEDTRRLKTLQKEAVQGIRRGDGSRIFLHRLASLMDNSEFGFLRKAFANTAIFDEFRLVDTEPEGEEGKTSIERLAHTVYRICKLSEKARREGLLALEDDIDEGKERRRDVFEYGMRFMVDGTDAHVIDDILSNLIALERDEKTRRLKQMQKEAVLSIQCGENMRILLLKQISFVDDSELGALRNALPDAGLLRDFHCEAVEPPDLAHIVRRAYAFNLKSRKKGFLALEDDIDEGKERRRDVFEYGMRFVVDGTDVNVIDGILSTMIALERDGQTRKLKTIQKEAVLDIQRGRHASVSLHNLMSYMDNSEFESLREALSDTDIFRAFRHAGVESADEDGIGDGIIVPKRFFTVLRELLENFIDRQEIVMIIRQLGDMGEIVIGEHGNICVTRNFFKNLKDLLGKSLGSDSAIGIINRLTSIIMKDVGSKFAKKIRLRKVMFEDIAMLDDISIQLVLREVDLQDLFNALKGADDGLRDRIFRNMSKRAAAMLKEDMEYMGPIRLKDVEEAKQRIISVICNYQKDGEIADTHLTG